MIRRITTASLMLLRWSWSWSVAGWIDRAVSIKPYFNDDVNSIPFAQALARFASGDVAMVFGSRA